ncbi:MAG: hypothetical protein HC788_00975 [Sphingopyxis sp.]|nr:hypothetical protein [Sphingopyxis sp.]
MRPILESILILSTFVVSLSGCGLAEDPSDDQSQAPAALAQANEPVLPADHKGDVKVPGSSRTASAQISDPFMRADASFSRFPLNEKAVPQAIGRLVNGAECDDRDILCEWEDARGTRHIMGGKLLAIKIVHVNDIGDRSTAALGIGRARQRPEVTANVGAFLPEISIRCLEADESGEGEGTSTCSGSFSSGGWFKLLFDAENKLTSARIDAFQIN